MSRFFPHAAYAEDQPLSRTILATHVLTRAVQAGSVVGLAVQGVWSAASALRSGPAASPSSGAAATASTTTATAAASLAKARPRLAPAAAALRASGTGAAAFLVLGAAGLMLRARPWEDIQWRDRAWRLTVNRGQIETDDWTLAGAAAGLLGYAAWRPAGLGWRGWVGAAGAGSLVGVMGYLGWRHGVHGGRFPPERAGIE